MQLAFENGFGWWAEMVNKRTAIVFIASLVIFIGFGKSNFDFSQEADAADCLTV